MLKDSPNLKGGNITIKDDPRILPLGKFLRKYKINAKIIIRKSKIRKDEPYIEKVYTKKKTRNFYRCLKYL